MSSPPVQLDIVEGRLHVDEPTGLHRASLLGSLDIPLGNVTAIAVVDHPVDQIKGWREGIGLPDLRMGTWRHDGVKDYVAVRASGRGLVISLTDEHYARMIVTVNDPEVLKSRIEQARIEQAGD